MRVKTIIGFTALLVAGVCIAVLADANKYATWLMLMAGALLTYIFLALQASLWVRNAAFLSS